MPDKHAGTFLDYRLPLVERLERLATKQTPEAASLTLEAANRLAEIDAAICRAYWTAFGATLVVSTLSMSILLVLLRA